MALPLIVASLALVAAAGWDIQGRADARCAARGRCGGLVSLNALCAAGCFRWGAPSGIGAALMGTSYEFAFCFCLSARAGLYPQDAR